MPSSTARNHVVVDGLGRLELGGCLGATACRNSAVDVPPAEMQEHPDRVDSTGTQERLSISSNTRSVTLLLSQVLKLPSFKAQARVRHSILQEWLQPCLFYLLGNCPTRWLTSHAHGGGGDALKPHFSHCTKQDCGFPGPGHRQVAPHCKGLGTSKF